MDDQSVDRQGGGRMTKKVLFMGTVAVVVSEWLMFELLRLPYRPPHDMTSFLGQEKFNILLLMCCVAAVWFGVLIWIFTSVPFWLATILVLSLAPLPWMRWCFTLRTLLIATTLVAVVLGLAVWATQ
jgi:hypothetical protein